MGDDDVRPGDEPRREGASQTSVTIDDAPVPAADSTSPASEPPVAPPEPMTEPAATSERLHEDEAASPVVEPSMASASADLAPPDRPEVPFGAPLDAAPPPRQSRSLMPVLLATIGLVLIVLLAVNLYLLVNPPAQNGIAALEAQASALDQRVAALEHRPAPTTDLGPLNARVKALEAKADQAAAPAPDAELPAKVAALDTRTDALGKALDDVKQQVAALPKTDLAPLDAKVADLSAALSSVKTDLAPLPAALAALDHRLAPIETEFSAPKIAANVSEARQVGSAAETRAAPLAVTAQAIVQAIDDGTPFAPEVAALQSLGASQAQLAVLRPLADKGAPTKDALIAGFAAVRDKMVIAAAPVQTGTVFDRMMANAQSLVKVRPAGASAGGDADAIVSRIGADVAAGDFKAAVAEWNQLPEASKAPSAAWADQLKARVAAESTARAIAAGAIAALGPTQ